MTPEEIIYAEKVWTEKQDICEASMNDDHPKLPKTLSGWIVYCQWCLTEYGASVLGT